MSNAARPLEDPAPDPDPTRNGPNLTLVVNREPATYSTLADHVAAGRSDTQIAERLGTHAARVAGLRRWFGL